MSAKTQIAARLDRNLVREIDRTAAADNRNRSQQLAQLLEIGLAGRRRLAELERLAAERVPDPTGGAARAAARDHLAEHRRLSGLDSSEETENA